MLNDLTKVLSQLIITDHIDDYEFMRGWQYIISFLVVLVSSFYLLDQSMLSRLQHLTRTIKPSQTQPIRTMSTQDLPKSWHSGPNDAFHGKITPDGPFKPEKDR